MSSSTMSILGLYHFGEYHNDDLFQNMKIPAGIDRQDLIDNILEQGAAFEILYPDYEYLKYSIGAWSRRWYRTMEKWLKALAVQYDPLNNYDRHEEWTDDGSRTGKTSDSVTGKTNTKDSVDTSGTDELSVVAYNSDTYHNKEKTETEGASTSEGQSKTDTKASGTSNETSTGKHSGHLWGNIGVTTSQEMLREELDVQKFNLIQQITDLFLTEFCILVY